MLIEARAISKTYGSSTTAVSALLPTSLCVEEGEFISIVGPSGSGKSTLMNILGLLDRPSSGELLLDGKNCAALSLDQIARIRNRSIGFIFQSYHLLKRRTIEQNVELPLIYAGMRRAERRRRAEEALNAVGLTHCAGHKPSQLSGGEQQRVAIARAMVSNPSIILADEPTGALDTANGREILRLLREFNRDGRTIIIVTHDVEIAQNAFRTIVLRDGRVVSDGPVCAAPPKQPELAMVM